MNRIFTALAVSLLGWSCSSNSLELTDSLSASSEIQLDASISEGLAFETKHSVSGTTFSQYETIGLFVTCHDELQTPPAEYVPHQLGYNNVKVTRSKTDWTFNNTVIGTNSSLFFLTNRNDRVKADVYAYAPYIQSVTRPDQVPFQHSLNNDLMWVTENSDDTNNKSLDPDPEGNPVTVPLHFKHSLCRLHFGFKTEIGYPNSESNHLMDYIHILKTGGRSTRLFESGVFNAIDGTFSDVVEAQDSVCVTLGRTSYSYFSPYSDYFRSNASYTYYDIMLYPTEVKADGDLTVAFGIDGFRYTYVINLSDVEHRDGSDGLGLGTFGFKTGFSYTFNFILDNYVHLKNIEIKEDWTEDNIYANL